MTIWRRFRLRTTLLLFVVGFSFISCPKQETQAAIAQQDPASLAVTYPAGWNLVAGPQGTAFYQVSGSLYTFRPGDASYEAMDSSGGVASGYGYWAYFARPAGVALLGTSIESASVHLQAGQFALLGNPSATSTVTIHDAAYAVGWNPLTGTYEPVTTLAPGHSAWVYVTQDDIVSVGPAFPTGGP
jgi:hypothetical protein